MFGINTETMILGKFLKIRKKDVVLDIGTNNGVLYYYMGIYFSQKRIEIDMNKKGFVLVRMNMEINSIEKIKVLMM